MRPHIHLLLVLALLAGCPDSSEPATLHVTPVTRGDDEADGSRIDVTVVSGSGSETQTVALDHVATFSVPAGDVSITAVGGWFISGGDTGGEGCDCTGNKERSVRGGRTYDVELSLDCSECWID